MSQSEQEQGEQEQGEQERDRAGQQGGDGTSAETPVGEVGDEQLPEDLRPSEDNPLARHPGQTGDDEDAIGQDREDGPETAPLDEDQADYGSGGAAG